MDINCSDTARIMKRNVWELTGKVSLCLPVVKENSHKNLRIISVQDSNLTCYEWMLEASPLYPASWQNIMHIEHSKLDYELDDWGSVVRYQIWAGDLSSLQHVHTESRVYPAFNSICKASVSQRLKRRGREALPWPPSSSENTNCWNWTSAALHAFMECTETPSLLIDDRYVELLRRD
jgi:hypothetical protein